MQHRGYWSDLETVPVFLEYTKTIPRVSRVYYNLPWSYWSVWETVRVFLEYMTTIPRAGRGYWSQHRGYWSVL